MKLHVDTTLPPAAFNAALLAACRADRARRVADSNLYRRQYQAYTEHGWDHENADAMARIDVAMKNGEVL